MFLPRPPSGKGRAGKDGDRLPYAVFVIEPQLHPTVRGSYLPAVLCELESFFSLHS